MFCIHYVYLLSILRIRTFKILPIQLLWKFMQFVYPPFYISFLSNLFKPFSILKKIGQSLTIFLVNYCIENNIWRCTRSFIHHSRDNKQKAGGSVDIFSAKILKYIKLWVQWTPLFGVLKLSYFSTYSPLELRLSSYRGTVFCIPMRRSLPPGIETSLSQNIVHIIFHVDIVCLQIFTVLIFVIYEFYE